MFKKQGFTLVELMIVVAIIGILAAIAIPNFVSMQLKAKRAEVPANVDGIKTAELAYEAASDAYIDCANYPGSTPKVPQAWTVSASGNFATLGWSPDGAVRGTYAVTGASATDFLVTGQSDVDGDLTKADYSATKTVNATINPAHLSVY